ncbi:Cytochrome p450 [Globisporangium polare]
MDKLEATSPWAIASAVVVGGALVWAVLPDAKQRAIRHLPAPASTLPVLGNSLDLAKYQTHRAHDWIVEQCALHDWKPWRLQILGSAPMVVLSSHEHFEDVLKTQFEVWDKGPEMKLVFDDVFGESIIAVDGEQWKFQRKKLSHLFTMRSYRETITTSIHKYIRVMGTVLENAALHPEIPFNLGEACHQMSFDIFSEVGFGLQSNALEMRDNNPFVVSLSTLSETFESRFQQPNFVWRLKRYFNIGSEKRMKECLAIMHGAMNDIILRNLARRNDPAEASSRPTKDVISLFMDEMDLDTATEDDFKLLRDIAFSIIGAGKDSTATSLMWAIIMLNRSPDVERRLRAELRDALPKLFTDKDYVPSMEDVDQLPFVEAVIKETLRLCPIVPLNAKEANRDTTLSDGTFIKKGTRAYIPSYALGRNPHVWGPDAAEFKPERWIEVDELTGKQKLIVVPATKFASFHAGPRICPGMRVGMFELKAALAYIVSKYHLKTLRKPEEFTYAVSAVLSVKGPLLVSVESAHARSY